MDEPAASATPGAAAGAAMAADARLLRYTHLIYALHAFAVLTGIVSAATIAGHFLFGLPSIIAVILNYALRGDVKSPLLQSHFRWQIRTFWFALLWFVVVIVVAMPLVLIIIGAYLAWSGFGIIGIWVVYRVARGWLALRAGRSMPAPETP
jgi:uncharacterized membrane protein